MRSGIVRVGIMLSVSMAGLFTTGPVHSQTTVAHWTFDTSSLTTDGGGNIVGAADFTGNHNMVSGSGVGTGAGNPYTSNPIPGGNSVGGQFGQGLRLTGFNNV